MKKRQSMLKSFTLSLLLIATITSLWAPSGTAAPASCQSLFEKNDSSVDNSRAMRRHLAQLAEQDVTIKQKQAAWNDDFSDPQKHDPTNYTYLVHSLNTAEPSDTKRVFGSQTERVNLLDSPERVSDLPIISGSLISHDKAITFGLGIGLILKVPAESIFATREVDLQSNQVRDLLSKSPEAAAKKVIEKHKKYGLDSPSDLLSNTHRDFYNEVLMLGTSPTGEKVEVVGYFVKVIDGMNVVDIMGNMEQLRALAEKNHLPLIEIQSSGPNIGRLKQYPEWQ